MYNVNLFLGEEHVSAMPAILSRRRHLQGGSGGCGRDEDSVDA